jgi:hypothetical protein
MQENTHKACARNFSLPGCHFYSINFGVRIQADFKCLERHLSCFHGPTGWPVYAVWLLVCGDEIEQCFGVEALRPMPVGGIAMEPDCGASGLVWFHALGKQSGDEASKDIAGTGRGETWRGVGVYGGAAVGVGDDGVWTFEDDDGTRTFGRVERTLRL